MTGPVSLNLRFWAGWGGATEEEVFQTHGLVGGRVVFGKDRSLLLFILSIKSTNDTT